MRRYLAALKRLVAVEPNVKPVPPTSADEQTFRAAMERIPLLRADKTYNTSHPDYDATAVRNYPGSVFNIDKATDNIVFSELKALLEGETVPDKAWGPIIRGALEEARTVAHAEQVFERRAFIERYAAELQTKYQAHYVPGWVNLEDAVFLYWLVRGLKPRTIVQTGVCNGLSSAFMMLALARNGPDGRLHVIDLPPVFNSKDPAWTIPDKVYGEIIPEGKSSGWMVPDFYRSRFEVHNGDAKELLPGMVDALPAIDLFYHDSDHTYAHMMFEFREVKRKLAPGGLIVADDISWNASLWDFADEHGVPSYNYKGSVGVAFF
jgi:predicted O-methyltransferase YrrM